MKLRSGKIFGNMTETSENSSESSKINLIVLIPFDPNNSMKVNSWLKYFNDKCHEFNLDDSWKINNITNYLKGNALTEYINSYDEINSWEEFTWFFTEKYIAPSIVSLNDFSQKVFHGNDLTKYFHDKLELGRQLKLSTQMILEGLTDGLPVNLRQLLSINSPNTPTEWLITTTKLLKIQNHEPKKVENPPDNNRIRFYNTQNPNPNWQPRHIKSNNFGQHSQIRPNNFRQGFFQRPNIKPFNRPQTHFQNGLPCTPCKFCEFQGIQNAYHWAQTSPFRYATGQVVPKTPDPLNDENQN